jgi:hypothetical protein
MTTKTLCDNLAAKFAAASHKCAEANRAYEALIKADFSDDEAERMSGYSKSERALYRISDRLRPAQCAFVRRKPRSRRERKDQLTVIADLEKAGIIV